MKKKTARFPKTAKRRTRPRHGPAKYTDTQLLDAVEESVRRDWARDCNSVGKLQIIIRGGVIRLNFPVRFHNAIIHSTVRAAAAELLDQQGRADAPLPTPRSSGIKRKK